MGTIFFMHFSIKSRAIRQSCSTSPGRNESATAPRRRGGRGVVYKRAVYYHADTVHTRDLRATPRNMKLSVLLSAFIAIASALPQRRVSLKPELQQYEDQQPAEQNYNNYQPQQQQPQQQQQQPQQEFRQQRPVEDFRPKVQLDTTTFIPIIRFDKEQGTDGSYKTAYETGNNIQAQEEGFLKTVGENQEALVQHGTYTYTAPDGQVITVEYTADEFGFRVKGDHIPTPPPVSPEIQKGLDLIYEGIKANQERAAIEAKNNPEAAKQQQDKAELDYKGFYYQQ